MVLKDYLNLDKAVRSKLNINRVVQILKEHRSIYSLFCHQVSA